MAKEKKTLFEEMDFEDVNVARGMVDECEEKLARNKKGIIIALLVPVFDIIAGGILFGVFGDDGGVAFGVWIVAAIVAYIIGGGLFLALKMVWRVTWFAFYIIPFFPIDLLVAAAAFCFSGAIALFLPIVFVLLSKHQLVMDRDAAEEFLKRNSSVGSTVVNDTTSAVYEPSSVENE